MVTARALLQSHYRRGVAVEAATRLQAVGDLITADGFLSSRADSKDEREQFCFHDVRLPRC